MLIFILTKATFIWSKIQ